MVICDADRVVFCHIPKNGGSSLRRHLADLWPDPRQHALVRPVEALGGAERDLTHVTVQEATDWFGETFVEDGYRVIAVVRPPLSRLRSVLYHYLRVMHPDERDFLPTDKAIAFLRGIDVPAICARAAEDPNSIHFRPQSDFVAGVPAAQLDLIPIQHLDARFPDIPHVNKAGRLPGWLRPLDNAVTRGAVRAMGTPVRRALRGALTRRDDQVDTVIAELAAALAPFARDFYAADQTLYDRVAETA